MNRDQCSNTESLLIKRSNMTTHQHQDSIIHQPLDIYLPRDNYHYFLSPPPSSARGGGGTAQIDVGFLLGNSRLKVKINFFFNF